MITSLLKKNRSNSKHSAGTLPANNYVIHVSTVYVYNRVNLAIARSMSVVEVRMIYAWDKELGIQDV